MPTSFEIKRALKAAGFEVYRTRETVVHVAERVRENLIMDSGVRVDDGLRVSFYARAERRDFPGDPDDALFRRARDLGQVALDRGYAERRSFITELTDPGDPQRTLDLWYQVQFEIGVASLELALEEVRFAFSISKQAKR